MSYYILPKNNNIITVNPTCNDEDNCKPFLSFSLYHYYNEITNQIVSMFQKDIDLSFNTYDDIIKIINPYEYIFSKVPGSKFSVSKLKPKSNLFYDFLEISHTLNIFDIFKNRQLNSLHITPNHNDTIECFEMLRENFTDNILYFDKVDDNTISKLIDTKFDFLFFETENENLDKYIISFIEIIMVILRNQNNNGISIIKIHSIFHKPILDLIFLLTSLFDKVYIIKPNTNNVTTFDKYIVCKNYLLDENKVNQHKINYFRLLIFLKKINSKNITSIIDFDLPYYFTIKIDDINIIIGQQQLESLNLIISIFKNKNKDEKIETIKKNNIQKSVNWCEKYKIPCNKFTEKINIFLPIIKEETVTNELLIETNY
jgi:hypothetical protein